MEGMFPDSLSAEQLRGRNGSGSESDCSFRSLAEKSERALALWQRAVSDHDSQHDMTFGHLPFGPAGCCRCKLFFSMFDHFWSF